MNTRIVSLLVAGFVGILIGWLLGPNIDEVRDDVAARLDAQLPQIAALQSGVAGIEQRLAAAPTADAAIAALGQRLDELQASVAGQTEAVATRVQEQAGAAQEQARAGIEGAAGAVQQRFDAIEAQIRELTAGLQQREEAPVAAAGPDAAMLASEVGAAGAVLLPGQAAIFGGGRLDLVSLDEDAGTASLRPEGGEEATVEGDGAVALSPTCTVRLAGVAAGAAYLMAEACEEAEATPPAAAAPAASEAAAPAPAGAAAPAPAAPQSAAPTNEAPADQPAAQDAQPGSDVPAQGAQAVPNQQPGMASGNAGEQGQLDRPAAATGAAPAQ